MTVLRFFVSGFLLSCSLSLAAIDAHAETPVAIDQRSIHENGCGPVSLLNAYRFSEKAWKPTHRGFQTKDSTQQFEYLTRRFGFHRSRSVYGHKRWNPQSGMQVLDLRDLANAFHQQCGLPKLSHASLFLLPKENHTDLLERAQLRMQTSLNNGFTAILNLSRFARQPLKRGGYRWMKFSSHFVTVTEVGKLSNGTLPFSYIDPWGGTLCKGTLQRPSKKFFASDITSRTNKGLRKFPTLEAVCPDSSVGLHLLQSDTPHVLVADHIIYAKIAP